MSKKFRLSAVLYFYLVSASALLCAEEINVSQYCALAVERLQITLALLSAEGRVPSAGDEEGRLWAPNGITAEQFYSYAGKYRKEVQAYLLENPDIQSQIDTLSSEIDALIE